MYIYNIEIDTTYVMVPQQNIPITYRDQCTRKTASLLALLFGITIISTNVLNKCLHLAAPRTKCAVAHIAAA